VETKWFRNGTILAVGYGYRSSKDSVSILQKLINDIYKLYEILPPTIIPLKLKRFDLFHLQMAMLEISETECIVQKNSIRIKDLLILQKALGLENIKIIDTEDPFCLSSIVLEDKILTHELDPAIKKSLNEITNKDIVEFDMSEYEKAGGSVRALIFDLFDPRQVKRKKYSNSHPSSPK
jgi:N-dimethylarginine dimethylaminohydrolase